MIKTIEEAKMLIEEAGLLKNDWEKLCFLKKYNSQTKVVLDSDEAYIVFKFKNDKTEERINEKLDNELGLWDLPHFEKFFGNAKGLPTLFEFIGIDFDYC